jgi:hypothetical protein
MSRFGILSSCIASMLRATGSILYHHLESPHSSVRLSCEVIHGTNGTYRDWQRSYELDLRPIFEHMSQDLTSGTKINFSPDHFYQDVGEQVDLPSFTFKADIPTEGWQSVYCESEFRTSNEQVLFYSSWVDFAMTRDQRHKVGVTVAYLAIDSAPIANFIVETAAEWYPPSKEVNQSALGFSIEIPMAELQNEFQLFKYRE